MRCYCPISRRMDTEFRFVLFDFGHPMSNNTIKSIMKSLEHILALGLSFSRYPKEMHFGISFLNSDFTILQSESYIRKNYDLLSKNINALLRTMKNTNKVTVPEYKHFLSKSIEMILRASQEKFKSENFCSQSKSLQIKVAVVTKKTASIVVDILTDVANKLLQNFSSATWKQNYKIVQILNEQDEKTHGTSKKSPFVKWTSCTDGSNDLNYFLKDWFLNRSEKLQILLSKDLNFTLQCDIDSFIVNPISRIFDGKYDFFNDDRCTSSNKKPLGILKPIHDLEIINRIPVSSLCPTLVFGIPRRIRATRNASSWVESQTNLKMFRELCRELNRTEQGLLTKSVVKSGRSELITFHFLTSDGYMLLMNDVTPEELYLPKRGRSLTPDSSDDESAASLIKSCIQKIKFLEEYSPKNYSSGLYQHLRNHLIQEGKSKSLFGSFDPSVKLFGKKCKKKGASQGDAKDENCSRPKKRAKENPEKELQNVHPALLSPEVVEKYRKVSSGAFNLPELGQDYNDIHM